MPALCGLQIPRQLKIPKKLDKPRKKGESKSEQKTLNIRTDNLKTNIVDPFNLSCVFKQDLINFAFELQFI